MTNKIEISRELAPCPFCGGQAELRQYRADGLEIKCTICHSGRQQRWLRKGRDWLADKMIDNWNIRAAPAVERKPAPVVGMLIDGVVHYFKDEYLVSESGAIVPEADELYRKSSAVDHQEPVGFRYRANGDWELMEESPFTDGRISHKEGGEELQPLYTYQPAPVSNEQPVAYMRNEVTPNNLVLCSFTDPGAFGVYRGPQSKSKSAPVAVVLPERKSRITGYWRDLDLNDKIDDTFARGWNACLDKVKEMNQ